MSNNKQIKFKQTKTGEIPDEWYWPTGVERLRNSQISPEYAAAMGQKGHFESSPNRNQKGEKI